MTTVSVELIKRIRCHINRTEKQAVLLNNQRKWLQLTAALNVLEDTAYAIEYYRDTEYPCDIRGKYLFTYGLIQALFVQNDSIISIYSSLFGKDEKILKKEFKEKYPKVYRIREMRDDVVGHPTFRNGNQFIRLAQCSMNKDSFFYIKWDGKLGTSESITVDVIAATDEVAKCVNDILEASVKDLDREFIEYIDRYKERKMKEIFNQLGYAKEKVLLNTYLKHEEYEATKEMVKQCENELIERYGSIEAADSYKYLLESIHSLYMLIDDGLERIPADIRPQIEKCLFENLFTKLEELQLYCDNTDSYFKNYGKEQIEPPVDYLIQIINDDLEEK